MTVLNRVRLRLLYSDGTTVISVFERILNRQDKIEAASYDPRTGQVAVAAARMAIADVPVVTSPFDQACTILDRLEELARAQQANTGEHSTGAATIGSIMRIARTELRIC